MRIFTAIRIGFAVVALSSAIPHSATAADASPAGSWRTVDDETGKVRSIVRIWEENGTFHGKIEKLFPDPGEPADPVCERCEGIRKGRQIVGMTILWDLSRKGNEWSGGFILDPENGTVYRCSFALAEGGKKLKVRGYVGLPLFGRTQTWVRLPQGAENVSRIRARGSWCRRAVPLAAT